MIEEKGFTILEIIIVIVVMSVLAWITWGQFELAKAKSRDVERRSDLHEFSKVIRRYYVDYQELPSPELINQLWGQVWDDNGYIYTEMVPKENYLDKEYCYKVYSEDTFALLADLENKGNEDCKKDLIECGDNYYCFEDKITAVVKEE